MDVQVELDLGCTTRTGNPRDCSPRPLFKRFILLLSFLLSPLTILNLLFRMDQSLLRRPVYSKLLALYNNYDVSSEMPLIYVVFLKVDTSVKETVTRSELSEEDDFLNEVMKSDVMKETMRWDS